MFDILKEFPNRSEIYDSFTLWLNVIGGLSIAATFCTIGVIFLVRAYKSRGKFSRLRVRVTNLFGYFLLSCGLSRVIDVLCSWHNLAILNGYIKLLTGILAFIAIYQIPSLLKGSKMIEEMSDVKEQLKRTNENLDQVKDISNKL